MLWAPIVSDYGFQVSGRNHCAGGLQCRGLQFQATAFESRDAITVLEGYRARASTVLDNGFAVSGCTHLHSWGSTLINLNLQTDFESWNAITVLGPTVWGGTVSCYEFGMSTRNHCARGPTLWGRMISDYAFWISGCNHWAKRPHCEAAHSRSTEILMPSHSICLARAHD